MSQPERASTEQPTPFLLYGVTGKVPVLNQVIEVLGKETRFEVRELGKPGEILAEIERVGKGLIIFEINTRDNLAEVLDLLIRSAARIKNNTVRIFGFQRAGGMDVEKILMKKGCSEILMPSLNLRAVKHKIDRFGLLVEQAYEKEKQNRAYVADQQKVGSVREAAARPTELRRPDLVWAEPVPTESDCWLILKRQDIRFIRGMWLLDVMGPPPSEGKWIELEGGKGWKWTPTKTPYALMPQVGDWIMVGKKPEFSWRSYLWQFVSEAPEMGFFVDQKSVGYRWKSVGDKLTVSKNPTYARKMLEAIQVLLRTERTFRKEQVNANGADYIDTDDETDGVFSKDLHLENDLVGGSSLDYVDKKKPEGTGRDYVDKKADGGTVLEGTFAKEKSRVRDYGTATKGRETTPEAVDWLDRLKDLSLDIQVIFPGVGSSPAKLLDFFEDEFTLEVDPLELVVDAQGEISLEMVKGKTAVKLNGAVTVLCLEANSVGRAIVDVRCAGLDPAELKKFQEIFIERQGTMSEFLKTARG